MQLSIVYHIFKNTNNLEESLKTLLNQIDKNFELVILDDDANTHAEEIINKFDFSTIKKYKYVRNNHNLGHSISFNMATNIVSAPFLYYTGSNSLFEPTFIKEINEILQKNNEIDVLSFWTENFDNKKLPELFELKQNNKFIYRVLLHGLKNKIFRLKFLTENNLSLIPFHHFVLIFSLQIMNFAKKWEFYNKRLISFKKNQTYSYNLCDFLDEAENLLNYSKSNQSEHLNKEAIEYYAIRNVFYSFITRMFSAYDNPSIRQNAINRVKYWSHENLKRWNKNPILIKEDTNFDNIKVIKFIKNFTFSIKYVLKNSKDL